MDHSPPTPPQTLNLPPSVQRREYGLLQSPAVGIPLMLALEAYARLRGIYRPQRPPHLHDYPLRHWPLQTNDPRPWIAFGDSLTQGRGAKPHLAFPAQLSQIVQRPILNAGVSGDTTADALQRIERDVLVHQPSLVLLCFGGNDLIHHEPTANTIARLRIMVQRIHDHQSAVLILGLRGSWLLGRDHDGPTRHLARQQGAALLPLILDGIWGHPLLMAEHVHPNHRGYHKLACRIAAQLQQLGWPVPLFATQKTIFPTHGQHANHRE